MQESEEVLGLALPTCDDAAVAHEPGEEALDLPAPLVPTELPAVLRLLPLGAIGRDELGAELTLELGVERVAVVGAVADQSLGDFFDEPRVERVDDELALSALTTCNPHGDRKAIAVCHCHDLGRLAAASDPNIRAPLFAPAWEPSMYASVRSNLPRSRRSSATAVSSANSVPSSTHFW